MHTARVCDPVDGLSVVVLLFLGSSLCYARLGMSYRGWTYVFIFAVFCLLGLFYFQLSATATKLKDSPRLTVSAAGSWRTIHKGVEYRKITLERSDPAQLVELAVVRFDPRWIMPRILPSSQFQLSGANVRVLAEKSDAIATINANYFDEKGRALGFLKSSGKDINPSISKSSLFTGILGFDNGAPFITHRDDFRPEQADEALQTGPLLLHRGRAVTVTRGTARYSRRSVIGIDREQRIVIAVTDGLFSGLNWAELQELFSDPQWKIETPDLLNLDGGGSAQLHLRTPAFQETVPGTTEVPVAIGFFMKPDWTERPRTRD